ncbi:MAG: cytochrome c [Nitrospinae bacterium]|nr:cytochrome c [Nitrospinota bacterium]
MSCVAAVFTAALVALAWPASAATKSETLYNVYCVQCHGVTRNGKGINSPAMAIQPRDHTDAKGMSDIPDSQLFKAIKEGGMAVNKSSLMPAWGDVMTDEEVNGLVAYLRQVCKCGPTK